MKRLASILCASLFTLVLLAASGLATQIIYRSPEQMGKESSLVVRGRVEGTRSYWNEKGTKIFTETRVRVEDTYKGRAPGEVSIIQLGGVAGNVRMTVHGVPSWRSDEEVLLFLEPYDRGTYQVSGFSQGKFEIERDPVTGKEFIKYPALEGVEVLRAPEGEGSATDSGRERVPLNRFINKALGLN